MKIKMNQVILMVVTATIVNCDWVEIPQAVVSSGKVTKQPDFTSYVLTTSSTTLQTPVFIKPTGAIKKSHNSNIKSNQQSNKTTAFAVDNISSTEISLNSKSLLVNNKGAVNSSNSSTSKNVIVSNADYKKDNNTENTGSEDYYIENDDYEISIDQEQERNDYSYANFIPFMSTIQSRLMKSAHKNKKSKLNVLKQLRDHLLGEIESRMTKLWNPVTKNREAREYKDDSHVDFPSNEGALLTIGFLTFAVFLIKLVLQLIQAIGNKMDNGDGTTTTTIIGRKRRATADEEAIKILNYIEQYHFK